MKRYFIFSITLCLFTCHLSAKEHTPQSIKAAVEAKNNAGALKIAQDLIKKKPAPEGLADSLYKSGAICVGRMELEDAATFFRLLDNNFPDSKHASTARAELVGCYNYLRQLDECIAQSKANLKKDPDSEWVEYWTYLIGQSNFRLWNFEIAEKQLKAFLEKYPDGKYAKHAKKDLGKINPPYEVNKSGLIKYTGRLKDDIRIKAVIKSLPQDIENGYKMLESRLGLDLRKDTRVLYYLEDEKRGVKSGVKASTFTVSQDYKPVVLMRFYTGFVASQPMDYRQTVTHELKHAGFRVHMGQGYDNLPEWVKEGLAVYGADDVETRMQNVLCNRITGGKDPMTTLNGVDNARHTNEDYMESSLAFAWLESKRKGNVKAFCQALVKGRPYKEIWAELSGMAYEKAIDEANAYCKKRVEAAIGDSLVTFRKLHADYQKAFAAGAAASKQWLDNEGRAAFSKWLKDNPEHPAAPFARFSFAHSQIKAGEGDAGRKLLRQILAEDSLRSTLLDDAQLWIGVSYNWERNTAKATEAFGVLLRDFPASHSAKQIAGQFQPAKPVTEK